MMYAFHPKGHGEPSFFVAAASLEDAIAAVNKKVAWMKTQKEWDYPKLCYCEDGRCLRMAEPVKPDNVLVRL